MKIKDILKFGKEHELKKKQKCMAEIEVVAAGYGYELIINLDLVLLSEAAKAKKAEVKND